MSEETYREFPTSSQIESTEWDNGELTVTFKRGGTYRYFGVSYPTYESLITAESVGQAHAQLIKGGGYRYQKVG